MALGDEVAILPESARSSEDYRLIRQLVFIHLARTLREMRFQQSGDRLDAFRHRRFRLAGHETLFHQLADAAPLLGADEPVETAIGDDFDAMWSAISR